MALELAHIDTDGQTGNYWRILRVERYVDNKTAQIMMGLYKDEPTRRVAGRIPMRTDEFNVTPVDFDTYFADAILKVLNVTDIIKAYEFLKTLKAPYAFDTSSDV